MQRFVLWLFGAQKISEDTAQNMRMLDSYKKHRFGAYDSLMLWEHLSPTL